MRTLTILLLALLTTFGFVPSALALGTESPSPTKARDADYDAGKKAIDAKDWTRAVEDFERSVARNPKNADAQNFLGYAYRNLGKLDLAFKHYEEALRLDPKHKGAHEYVGETYLLAGNLPKAEVHLATLAKLCTGCEEYRDLKEAIAEYKAKKK